MISDQKVLEIMDIVYDEVEKAICEGNPPFAAVMTDLDGNVIATAHNTQNSTHDPVAHAEILLLREVGQKLQSRKLNNCIMFVNAESCPMCACAAVKSKLETIYYGAPTEERANPNIRASYVQEMTSTPFTLIPGIMKEKFMEQIIRGRIRLEELETRQENRIFKELV
jgi:tRNA(adenine34) deaminase